MMSHKLKILVVAILAMPFLYSQSANALELPATTQSLTATKSVNLFEKEPTTSPFTTKVVKKEEKKAEPVKEPETPKVVTYTVVEGDSLSSIAMRYNTNWLRLWQKNTQLQNQDVLKVGDTLTIPNPDEVLAERATVRPVEAPTSAPSPQTVNYTIPTVQAPVASYNAPQSGEPNAYGWGQCTWYVKNMRPSIGGYWGNAGPGWLSNARAYGYSTGSTPVAGAIGVQYGHVVIIESVNGDGTVNLSEMNYNGGVGVVHYDRRPVSAFIGFIYA